MSDLIRRFISDAQARAGAAADLADSCAKQIAALVENPASRLAESAFYTALTDCGVAKETVSELRRTWESQFNLLRDLSNMGPTRTPGLRLFRMCVESAARRKKHSIERALSGAWLKFAVAPDRKEGLDFLISAMSRFGIPDDLTQALEARWDFIFTPGGHEDLSVPPAGVFYEIEDKAESRVALLHPFESDHSMTGIRQYRARELAAALEIIDANPVVLIQGHPGWRAAGDGFDLWVETLAMELGKSGMGTTILSSQKEAEAAARSMDVTRPAAVVATEEFVAKGADLLPDLTGRLFLKPKRGRAPKRRLILMADSGFTPHEAKALEMVPMLTRLGATKEVPAIAINPKLMNVRQVAQTIFHEKIIEMQEAGAAEKSVADLEREHAMIPLGALAVSRMIKKEWDTSRSIPDLASARLEGKNFNDIRAEGVVRAYRGSWSSYIDRMLALSKENSISISHFMRPFTLFCISLAKGGSIIR